MGNQNSNEARSAKLETSSKGESETWDDVIVDIKEVGLSRQNSMVNPPETAQGRSIMSPLSSKAESKESESWDDVVSSMKLEVAKSFSRSSSAKDIPTIREEATSSTKPTGEDVATDEKTESLEVSSVHSQQATDDASNENNATPKGPDASKDTTVKTDASPEPGKESHFNTTTSDGSSTASESSPRAGLLGKPGSDDTSKKVDDTNLAATDAESGKDKEGEKSPVKKLSPLQSFLNCENIPGDSSEDGSRSPLLTSRKVQKSKSLTEKLMTGGRRGKNRHKSQKSRDFSNFSCSSCW